MDHLTYHADISRISKSGLDLVARSPRHYWEKYINPDREPEKKTPALIIGGAAHCLILEPDAFMDRYAIAPKFDRRTTKGKEAHAEFTQQHSGKEILDADDFAQLERMHIAVRSHHAARRLLEMPGQFEQPFIWNDPDELAPCKCRADKWIQRHNFCVDLKTTDDASPAGFRRSVWKFRYHVQAAFYSDGIAAATGEKVDFVFVAVEKSAPYAVAVYTLPDEWLAIGRELYRADVAKWLQCSRTGEWPAYGDDIQMLYPNNNQ